MSGLNQGRSQQRQPQRTGQQYQEMPQITAAGADRCLAAPFRQPGGRQGQQTGAQNQPGQDALMAQPVDQEAGREIGDDESGRAEGPHRAE